MGRLIRTACAVGVLVHSLAFAGAYAGDDLAAVSAKPPIVEDAVPAGPTVEQRLAEIQRRVQHAAIYPAIARARGVEGASLVAFEIDAVGRPTGIETAETSGSGALDHAARAAVAGAGPLPWVYGRVTVPVQFKLVQEE